MFRQSSFMLLALTIGCAKANNPKPAATSSADQTSVANVPHDSATCPKGLGGVYVARSNGNPYISIKKFGDQIVIKDQSNGTVIANGIKEPNGVKASCINDAVYVFGKTDDQKDSEQIIKKTEKGISVANVLPSSSEPLEYELDPQSVSKLEEFGPAKSVSAEIQKKAGEVAASGKVELKKVPTAADSLVHTAIVAPQAVSGTTKAINPAVSTNLNSSATAMNQETPAIKDAAALKPGEKLAAALNAGDEKLHTSAVVTGEKVQATADAAAQKAVELKQAAVENVKAADKKVQDTAVAVKENVQATVQNTKDNLQATAQNTKQQALASVTNVAGNIDRTADKVDQAAAAANHGFKAYATGRIRGWYRAGDLLVHDPKAWLGLMGERAQKTEQQTVQFFKDLM